MYLSLTLCFEVLSSEGNTHLGKGEGGLTAAGQHSELLFPSAMIRLGLGKERLSSFILNDHLSL